MIYLLLWAESLALCVLAVLFAFAFWHRKQYRPLGIIVLVFTLLLTVFFTGAQLGLSLMLLSLRVTPNYLIYSATFTLALIALTVALLRRGYRKEEDGATRRIVHWPFAHLGIAALAAFALYLTTMMTIDTTMQMKLANVRLEAGALAMSEAPPRPPERENAAVVYTRVFERIDASKKWDLYKHWTESRAIINGKTNDDTRDPKVREYLTRLKPTLDLLRRAAVMPNCAFERTYATISLDIQLPELSKMRECARLLGADARCRAADGDVKGALQNVRAIQGLAEHMSYEPMLISGLVSVACGNIGVDTLEFVMRTTEPTAADLEVLGAEDHFSYRRVYKRAMRGEHAFGLSGFALLGDRNGALALESAVTQPTGFLTFLANIALPYWRIYLLPTDLSAYNETMTEYEQAAMDTFKDGQAKFDRSYDSNQPRRGILTALLTPALGHSFKTFFGAESRQRLALLARAVSLYRAKHKAFPKDLEALVPEYISEIPTDPFDEKPLRMKTHAAGVTLYSVGINAIDDGGIPPEKNRDKTGDVILCIGKVDDPATPTPASANPALPGPPKSGF